MSETRILIADADDRTRLGLHHMLTQLGYLVVGETDDGLAALRIAQQIHPDVVLVDVHLNRSDGLAVATQITQEQIAPVLLTATETSRQMVEQARAAGVLGCLVKPLKDSELLPTIEVVRARWQEQRLRKRELDQLRDKLETRKVIERAKGYLMDSQGLAESDAFRKIQRLAMNNRKTMHEVAQAILLAQQLQPDRDIF